VEVDEGCSGRVEMGRMMRPPEASLYLIESPNPAPVFPGLRKYIESRSLNRLNVMQTAPPECSHLEGTNEP
jgi:hypothetical protein